MIFKEAQQWTIKIWEIDISYSLLKDNDTGKVLRILSLDELENIFEKKHTLKWFLEKLLYISNITPYVSEKLWKGLNLISYKKIDGTKWFWIETSILADICDTWINAKNDWALLEDQIIYYDKAIYLIRILARVWIIALVDEATWYQNVRSKNGLNMMVE